MARDALDRGGSVRKRKGLTTRRKGDSCLEVSGKKKRKKAASLPVSPSTSTREGGGKKGGDTSRGKASALLALGDIGKNICWRQEGASKKRSLGRLTLEFRKGRKKGCRRPIA